MKEDVLKQYKFNDDGKYKTRRLVSKPTCERISGHNMITSVRLRVLLISYVCLHRPVYFDFYVYLYV